MLKNKLILLIFALLFLSSFNHSFGYEAEPTHKNLTKKIIEIYNKYNDIKITEEQANWIIKGAVEEDTVPRWINHFYDPVYKNGWSGEKQGDVSQDTVKNLSKIFISSKDAVSSLDWVHNYNLQDKYGFYAGNQTYDWALENYAYATDLKNKTINNAPSYVSFENAFKALGHTLHLLEDLGVPAHTRNDTHADVSITNDTGDPYEKWAAEPGNGNLSALDNLKVGDLNFNCQSVDDCFVNLAKYTNENFYSKDTIDDQKYIFLKSTKIIDLNSGDSLFYRKDSFDNEYLFKIHTKKDNKDIIEDNQIHQAYWNLLSKQIVLAGVQALKVFYQNDAPKEIENKQYQISYTECNIPIICAKESIISPFGEFSKLAKTVGSFMGNVADTTKNVLINAGSLITNIFSNNNNLKQISQVDLTYQTGNNNLNQTSVTTNSTSNKSSQNQSEAQNLKSQIIDLKKEITSLNKELNKQTGNPNQNKPVVENSTTSTAVDNTQKTTVKTTVADFCKFSTSQQPKHSGVIINEIAWMGSIKSSADEWLELKNISSSEVNLANWQLISKDGQIKINFSDLKNQKIGAGVYVLLERTDDNTVLGIAADIIYKGGLANTDEKLRLFDGSCNLIDEVLANSSWSAGDKDLKKTMERNTDGSTTSLNNQFGWHTSNNGGGTPKANNSLQQVVYSGGGGGGGVSATLATANNQQQTNTTQESPKFYEMAINEISYNPDGDDMGREWIEIFNKSTSTIDLTGFKLFEGETNHGLFLKQGDRNLIPDGYVVIANDKDKFLIDYPDYAGIIFESSFSLGNNSKVVIFKNGDLKIDEVSYASSTGAYNNGKSLQIIGGEWKEELPTPGRSNNSIFANFSFSPSLPKENELVIFDAASSTAGLDIISLYEWQFGDGTIATSTESQIGHAFQIAGIYVVKLTVYGDSNSSSTTSLAVNVNPKQEQSSVNHILISEIMPGAGTGKANEEFIELYNPTGSQIDLTGYFLERKNSVAATTTTVLANEEAFNGKTIASKGFLLVASQTYQGTKTFDLKYSQVSNHLAYNDDVVILYSGASVIDEISYQNINEGQSLERKAFSNDSCVSSQGDGEFLGNGCDTGDSVNDFEIRTMPNPQNSASLFEPRNAPAQIQNFKAQYDPNAIQLTFNWNPSVDYGGSTSSLIYKIIDLSQVDPGLTLQNINTTSTITSAGINEVGRTGNNNYKFSVQAFDSDGLGSAPTTVAIDVPSFVSNIYFFKDPNSQNNYIESYYNGYPFVPNKSFSGAWKVAVFYLNQDAPKIESFDEAAQWGGNSTGAVKLVYSSCVGYGDIVRGSLILPGDVNYCSNAWGGERNLAFLWSNLEDNHFIAKLDSSNPAFKDGDYVTAAFYAYGGNNDQKLVAVDKIKYQFKNSVSNLAEWQQAPKFPDNSQLDLNLDKLSSKLIVSWPGTIDTDTIDSKIIYEIQYAEGGEWQLVSNNGHTTNAEKIVSPGDNFSIKVRAKDDFGNFDSNQILSGTWSYPTTIFYMTQTNVNDWSYSFGNASVSLNYGDVKSLQSIIPEQDFQFNKVVLRLWQIMANDYMNLRLRVYADNNGKLGGNVLGEAAVNNLYNPDKNSDIAFSFNNPVSVVSGNKYWLILDVSNYNFSNYWENAISTNNSYLKGDSGRCFDICFGASAGGAQYPYFDVPMPAGADWYMKIGME